jgi:endogenous inhibitor of DNA gyrase (YacG/DUF329 family)
MGTLLGDGAREWLDKLSQPRPALPSPKALDKVLDRIGLSHLPKRAGRWNLLNWYVQLLLKDLDQADVLSATQEEFAALDFFYCRDDSRMPHRWELEEFCEGVSYHLTNLADKGITTFRRYNPMCTIAVFAKLKTEPPKGYGAQIVRWDHGREKGRLLFELIRLLEEFPAGIERCPECSSIFLKPRTNAEFCSRRCQSSHSLKEWRVERRKRTAKRRKAIGRRKHGKKRR